MIVKKKEKGGEGEVWSDLDFFFLFSQGKIER